MNSRKDVHNDVISTLLSGEGILEKWTTKPLKNSQRGYNTHRTLNKFWTIHAYAEHVTYHKDDRDLCNNVAWRHVSQDTMTTECVNCQTLKNLAWRRLTNRTPLFHLHIFQRHSLVISTLIETIIIYFISTILLPPSILLRQ